MNLIISSFSRLRGLTLLGSSIPVGEPAVTPLRSFSSCIVPGGTVRPAASRLSGPLSTQAEGSGVFQQLPWQYQQIRTGKRGMEYQPKNIKRKRTHGWIKRIRTQGGIEVILRRMLKGRKSLTH